MRVKARVEYIEDSRKHRVRKAAVIGQIVICATVLYCQLLEVNITENVSGTYREKAVYYDHGNFRAK